MTVVARYPKPEVLAGIPLDRHAVIEASAGTGKTYTLEHLIVEILLAKRVPITEVLVVTFTEKATGELRARVRHMLQHLLDLRPEDGADASVPDERCWVIGDEERKLLHEALAAFDSATICTIHSFCRSVLTENAFANQRLFDEELVDGREVFGSAFKDALREEFAREGESRELLRLFLEQGGGLDALEETLYRCFDQKARIEPADDPERYERLIAACGLDDRAVAQVRLDAKTHRSRKKDFDGSLDAILAAVADCKAATGLDGRLAAFEQLRPDSKPVKYVLEVLENLPEGTRGRALFEPLLALVEATPTARSIVATRFLPSVAERVARGKRDSGQFDFGDMLSLVRESLEGPHGAALVELLRSRYRFALIDEFQDTDETQWAIFRKLFFDSEGRCLLYLIGDPKQAIYGFRGADVNTYLAARWTVLGSGGARVVIDRNFRSTADLIDGYNAILDQGASEPFFTGEIRYDEPVACGNSKLAATGPDGEPVAPVHVFELQDQKSVAQAAVLPLLGARIAQEIKRLIDPERPALRFDRDDGKGPRPVCCRDIFILARTGNELRGLAGALREAGIDHAFYKQEGLFQTEEAEHIQDLLEAIAEPGDPSKRLRAWMTPFFGLQLHELAGAGDLEDHPLVKRLLGWKEEADKRRYERLFSRILDESGVVRREILVGDGERALTNYLHLFELLLEELGRSRQTLPELAAGLRALRDGRRKPKHESGNVQRLESERDAVQLLTTHVSKGLEAPVVFLIGGLSKLGDSDGCVFHDDEGHRVLYLAKPSSALAARVAAESEQEDERLLYVALTRAKARLYLPMYCAVGEDGPERPKRLDGCYRKINDRLMAIQAEALPEHERLFVFDRLEPEQLIADGGELDLRPLASLEPRPELVEQVDRSGEREALRDKHAGYFVTSYSRMGKGSGADDDREERANEDRAYVPPGPEELPGGANTGNYLHELLAELPTGSAAQAADPEAFGERPEVKRLFETLGRRYGIAARFEPHARRLVHAALTAKLELGGRRLEGISRARRVLREMEFFFPVPEASHPLLSQPKPGRVRPFEIRRGFVKGYVDVLFEHEGLAYFGDWKSDSLPSFEPASLEAHVERDYRVQAKLYTLALVKMLGLRAEADYDGRFGGLLYVFLRGLKTAGEGIYFERPSWRQVVAWEQELLRRSEFGFGGEE